MSTRTIKVNNAPLVIPAETTSGDIKRLAIEAGIRPTQKGVGGNLELRGYHLRSGAAFLLKDKKPPQKWINADKFNYVFTEFSLRDVESSNSLGSGRETYWPASKGRLNPYQIKAAVDDNKVWPIHRVLNAPSMFQKMGSFAYGWTRDEDSMIIQNASGPQFDDSLTLSESQGKRLIDLMITHAYETRQGWAKPTVRPGPPVVKQPRVTPPRVEDPLKPTLEPEPPFAKIAFQSQWSGKFQKSAEDSWIPNGWERFVIRHGRRGRIKLRGIAVDPGVMKIVESIVSSGELFQLDRVVTRQGRIYWECDLTPRQLKELTGG